MLAFVKTGGLVSCSWVVSLSFQFCWFGTTSVWLTCSASFSVADTFVPAALEILREIDCFVWLSWQVNTVRQAIMQKSNQFSVEIRINKNTKRIDQCKQSLSLCRIGLVKDHGSYLLVNQPCSVLRRNPIPRRNLLHHRIPLHSPQAVFWME